MTTLEDIERLALEHREDRDALINAIDAMNDDIERVRKGYMISIRPLIIQTARSSTELRDAVESAPELFTKPKTQTFHGIKVGFQKQKGKISFADAAKVVAMIRKHLKGKFKSLVKVTEAPDKNALANLSGVELKKIGCTVTEDTDAPIVRPVESEAEKAVTALLKDAEEAA